MTDFTEQYLDDIAESIALIREYADTLTFSEFELDRKIQDAVCRRLAIIGEAAKQLPEHFRATHSSLPWKDIMGMRDILVHEYGGVQIETVWDTVQHDLATLEGVVRSGLSKS